MKYFVFSLACYTLSFHSFSFSDQSPYPYSAPDPKDSYPYGPKKEPPPPPVYKPREVENPHSFRFSLKHREANGIGYNQGYTSLDGFFLPSSFGNWHPFFDFRVHMFNNGRPAANLGVGIRYLPDFTKAVFGLNTFLDIKSTVHSSFEQVGAGFEILGAKWEMRANGYLPVFGKNNVYQIGFYKFKNHSALFRANHEIVFKGFDVSLGRTLVSTKNWDLASTLGGYMFFADYHSKAQGGLFKLKSNFGEYFSLESQFSYDSYFKAIFQMQGAVSLSFGKRIKTNRKNLPKNRQLALAGRVAEEVDRFEMIVSGKYSIDSVAKDPRTDRPLHIVFVNNQQSEKGHGTAGSPYNSLAAAQENSSPWDMIYVYTGNGSSFRMNNGITLQEGQWLQGSSLPFLTDTAFGVLSVPKQTTVRPNITNVSGSAVTVASNTIINGVVLRSPTVNVSGSNFENVAISHSQFGESLDYDLNFTNGSGNIYLVGNTSLSESGLFFSTNYNTRLVLDSNNFANPGIANADINFSGNSQSTVIFRNRNEFHDSSEGTLIQSNDTSTVACNIVNNLYTAIPDGTLFCLKILATDSSTMTSVINNNLFNSSAPGLGMETQNTSTGNWFVINNVGHYTGHNTPIFPFGFQTDDSSTATLLLTNNSASNNGFGLDNSSGSATFNAQSPTLNLAGLELLNTGSFTTTGTITYIPYELSSIPTIE